MAIVFGVHIGVEITINEVLDNWRDGIAVMWILRKTEYTPQKS